jgi:DNA-binding GntR family transcriptional regulator
MGSDVVLTLIRFGSCAIISAVQTLWDARARSPQNHSVSTKVRAIGIKPRIDEHTAILKTLKRHNADEARAAMRDH